MEDRETFSRKVAEHLVNYDTTTGGDLANHIAYLSLNGQAESEFLWQNIAFVGFTLQYFYLFCSTIIQLGERDNMKTK